MGCCLPRPLPYSQLQVIFMLIIEMRSFLNAFGSVWRRRNPSHCSGCRCFTSIMFESRWIPGPIFVRPFHSSEAQAYFCRVERWECARILSGSSQNNCREHSICMFSSRFLLCKSSHEKAHYTFLPNFWEGRSAISNITFFACSCIKMHEPKTLHDFLRFTTNRFHICLIFDRRSPSTHLWKGKKISLFCESEHYTSAEPQLTNHASNSWREVQICGLSEQ